MTDKEVDSLADLVISPIARLRSPFKQKFGIPRQTGIVKSIISHLDILQPYAQEAEIIRGLEDFSHLWVIFAFHKNSTWQPLVRPPRLGGDKKLGVWATRSPFRPNQMGLSVGKIEEIQQNSGEITIDLSGLDILDGTPVYDIKPYLPYADSISEAIGGFQFNIAGAFQLRNTAEGGGRRYY